MRLDFTYRILVPNPDLHSAKKKENSLRSKTKFHEYLRHIKHNYLVINYQMVI